MSEAKSGTTQGRARSLGRMVGRSAKREGAPERMRGKRSAGLAGRCRCCAHIAYLNHHGYCFVCVIDGLLGTGASAGAKRDASDPANAELTDAKRSVQ